MPGVALDIRPRISPRLTNRGTPGIKKEEERVGSPLKICYFIAKLLVNYRS
jgi:hypothetical protein